MPSPFWATLSDEAEFAGSRKIRDAYLLTYMSGALCVCLLVLMSEGQQLRGCGKSETLSMFY